MSLHRKIPLQISVRPLRLRLGERAPDAPQSSPQHQKKPKNSQGLINGPESTTHSFITDEADVRQMEQGLLKLLSDFHSGKLQAFGQDITFEKMESVREQQEKLARLHFDLNNQQELQDTEDGRRLAKENMSKLIESLQQLSFSIEQLQSRSTGRTSTFKT